MGKEYWAILSTQDREHRYRRVMSRWFLRPDMPSDPFELKDAVALVRKRFAREGLDAESIHIVSVEIEQLPLDEWRKEIEEEEREHEHRRTEATERREYERLKKKFGDGHA